MKMVYLFSEEDVYASGIWFLDYPVGLLPSSLNALIYDIEVSFQLYYLFYSVASG